MIRYRLYFGRTTKDGSCVDDDALKNFLESTVTPVYPAFTLYDAHGYWRGDSERTTILELLSPYPDQRAGLEELAQVYIDAFEQETVLITQETVSCELVTADRIAA